MRNPRILVVLLVLVSGAPPKYRSLIDDTKFPTAHLSRWHPRLIELLEAQPLKDKSAIRFAPNLNYEIFSDPASHYEHTLFGKLTLGRLIASGKYSAVYSVREDPELVIKYQSNCERERLPHPSLMDFWGLSEAYRRGVPRVPRVYSVSPAVGLPPRKTTKCNFRLSETEWDKCAGSAVRYIVMQRLGPSLCTIHSHSSQSFSALTAVRYGIEIFDTLLHLHMNGMIHGDIHSGNLVYDTDREHLYLIDFDRFMYKNSLDIEQGGSHRHMFVRVHRLLSPWEIEGYSPSFRDDIYRAISTIAELMHPYTLYNQFLSRLSPPDLLWWKRRGYLFGAMPKIYVGDNWGVSGTDHLVTVGTLTQIFHQILVIAKSPVVSIPITHEQIIALLKQAESILSHNNTA
jgi:serine/threonine protein kinase